MRRASRWSEFTVSVSLVAMTIAGCAGASDLAQPTPSGMPAFIGCPPVAPPAAEPQAQSSQPGVRSIARFREASELISELRRKFTSRRVLIVFDLDNTLLTSRSDLGSDAWYTWQSSIHKSDDKSCAATKSDQLLTAQGLLYALGRMRPTEPGGSDAGTVGFVRELQGAGHPTIVLTSRGPEFNDVTRRELRKWGLDFSKSAIGPQGGYPGELMIVPATETETAKSLPSTKQKLAKSVTQGRRPTRYEDGVFLTAGQHKGAMLRLLLTRTQTVSSFDAVVFIDDTQKHTEHMRDAFDGSPVYVQAYLYENCDVLAPADFMKDSARLAAASAQWEQLRRNLQSIYNYDPLDPQGP